MTDTVQPSAETDWDRARHVAALTAALKRIDWQAGRQQGSQWLAGELVTQGMRVAEAVLPTPVGGQLAATAEPSANRRQPFTTAPAGAEPALIVATNLLALRHLFGGELHATSTDIELLCQAVIAHHTLALPEPDEEPPVHYGEVVGFDAPPHRGWLALLFQRWFA